MIKIARLLAAACVVAVAYAGSAGAETPSDEFGSFPGCDWRVRPDHPNSKPVLYCPNQKGKMWQLTFDEEFDQSTLARARDGDAHAIGIIADIYLNARDFPVRDIQRGITLLRKASDMGDPAATRNLALWTALLAAREDPLSGKWMPEEARLNRIAAEKGDATAMYQLSYDYLNGIGVKKDIQQSVEWMRRSAQAGNTAAMRELGRYYDQLSEIRDLTESVRWYRAAADAGDAGGMSTLAFYYESGHGVAKDEQEAKRWREKAQAAYVGALVSEIDRLGIDRASYQERELADAYLIGKGVTKDVGQAVHWYELAANAGDRESAEKLESLFRDGTLLPADPAKADYWDAQDKSMERDELLADADRGDINALRRLAAMALTGVDPNKRLDAVKNLTEGAEWTRKAAEAGDSEAMYRLSLLYAGGTGVRKDATQSKLWLDKAAAADPFRYAPIETLLQGIDRKDDGTMLLIAARLFHEGRKDEAVFWYFVAELRARADVTTQPCRGDFCADGAWDMFAVMGPSIKQYAAGDIPKFAATIDKVVAWDEAHPDGDAAAHEKVRASYRKLRDDLLAKKDEIRAARQKQGLPNSSP